MPIPLESDSQHSIAEREHLLERSNWDVDISNYREVGEVISTFNQAIGNDAFVGTASMSIEDGIRKLTIELYYDESENYRCYACHNIPANANCNNPMICTFCGWKICDRCNRQHERSHWRPQRTLGGDVMCNGDTVRCGRDQCPICHGAPF